MKFDSLYKHLEEYVFEHWGECCETFEWNCVICQQYVALVILKANVWLDKTKGKKES